MSVLLERSMFSLAEDLVALVRFGEKPAASKGDVSNEEGRHRPTGANITWR